MENKEIVSLLEKIKEKRSYSRRVGYNIFSAIGLKSKEVIHSSILASFLNPNARHGLGTTFLQLFIDQVGLQSFNFDVANAKVGTESFAPAGGVNGRIDIFLSSIEREEPSGKKNNDEGNVISKKAIIIENKLNAGDQDRQLKRYAEWAEKEGYDYNILYLTLDKHKPSPDSRTGKETCISFEEHILPWLEKCIEKAALAPDVREPLNQYRIYITGLVKTQIMDKIIAEKIEAAELIKDEYFNGLAIAAKEFVEGLKLDGDNYLISVEDPGYKDYQYWSLNIRKPEWEKLEIRFQYDSKNFENLQYGAHFLVVNHEVIAKNKEDILTKAEKNIKDIQACKHLSGAEYRAGYNKDRWPFKVDSKAFAYMSASDIASQNSQFKEFIVECVNEIAPFIDEYENM